MTTWAEPSTHPAWVGEAKAQLMDARLHKLSAFAESALEAENHAQAERAVATLVQAAPQSLYAWQLALDVGAMAEDTGWQRAACERCLAIGRAMGREDIAAHYLALDAALVAGLDEPTYRLDESYVSCEWIEGGLTYGTTELNVCCIPNQGGNGGWEKIVDYSPDTIPDLLAFVRTKQRMRHAAQSGGVDNCRGCSRLAKNPWPVKLPVIDTLNFSHFHRCNLRCNYCYLEQPDYVPDKKALEDPNPLAGHMRYWRSTGMLATNAVVYWGGGEPSILRDFDETLSQLVDHGCRNVVNTNGIRYSEAIETALRAPGQMVVCSIDAGTAETYRRKKGADVFDRVLRNCERYARAASQGRMALKYIVDLDNHGNDEIDGFVERAAAIGIGEGDPRCQQLQQPPVQAHGGRAGPLGARPVRAGRAGIHRRLRCVRLPRARRPWAPACRTRGQRRNLGRRDRTLPRRGSGVADRPR